MNLRIRRREFLGRIAAGGAVLSMPAFLAGCGVASVAAVPKAEPQNPFLDWFGVDEAIISKVFAELAGNGAETAELYFQHRRSNLLTMEEGVVARADSDLVQGVGLRVLVDGRTGYAFTEELTLESMIGTARRAAAIANGRGVGPPDAFASKRPGDLYRTEVAWSDIAADLKLPVLERVDRRARSADPSVRTVSAQLADVDERILIATLEGHLVTDHRPLTRLSVQVTAARGRNWASGFANISARDSLAWYTDERVDGMVQEALDRTLVQFEAGEAPEGELPVVLQAGTSGILLHEAIGHALEADFASEGTSPYAGMMGETIAQPFVTVVDKGTVPNERGALNYDDEGTACGRNVLVEGGVLRSWLHDTTTARHYGVAATGSARRESYRHAPMPRMTCTYLENGPHTRNEVIAAVERGILVETFADGRVEIGAGDYSFRIRNGWLIEKGKKTAPLRDVDIAGNGPETLRRIRMVADDMQFDTGGWTCGKKGQRVPVSQGTPTVLIDAMKVGGETAG
jgi:TldD protein